jgi:hypothetical protein
MNLQLAIDTLYDELISNEILIFQYELNGLEFEIILRSYKDNDRIFINAQYNYDYTDLENEDSVSVDIKFRPKKEFKKDKIKELLGVIHDLKNTHFYSKILDAIIDKNSKDELVCKSKFFLVSKEIEECCVCYEKNTVLTECGHNLCRICYIKCAVLCDCECPTHAKIVNCPLCKNQLTHIYGNMCK